MQPLDPDEADGLEGLTYDMVEALLGYPPEIRPVQKTGRHNTRAHFRRYFHTGLWRDRVAALFGWADEDKQKKRRWDDADFRVLARDLSLMYGERRGTDALEGRETRQSEFRRYLCRNASEYIWILPRFDKDSLSILSAQPLRRNYPRAIDTSSQLARVRWHAPFLDGVSEEEMAYVSTTTLRHDARGQAAVKNLIEALQPDQLRSWGKASEGDWLFMPDQTPAYLEISQTVAKQLLSYLPSEEL